MCGVVGVFGVEQAQVPLFRMMSVLQYRGEQSCGYSLAYENGTIFHKKELGHLGGLLEQFSRLSSVKFYSGIGHLRYGTAGARKSIDNAQPLLFVAGDHEIHIAHNGDTPFFEEMRKNLSEKGVVFRTNSDTELILNFIGLNRNGSLIEAVHEGLSHYKGTYSVVILVKEDGKVSLIAARDPSGNRPLVLGKLGGGFLIASEDHAFEAVKGEVVREVRPGEMLLINESGIKEYSIPNRCGTSVKHCSFELNYFSLPRSKIFGVPVYAFREAMGVRLARIYGHHIRPDDVITFVPDSSNFFAAGFCKFMQMPLDIVFIRRHHGAKEPIRSFTEDTEQNREDAVRNKFSFIREKVMGKRVVLLDDSIVRGTVSKKLVALLLEGGATEVLVIVSFPPIIGPCYKGMDFLAKLIAADHTKNGLLNKQNLQQEIGASLVGYPEIEDVYQVLAQLKADPKNFCMGCAENKEPIWSAW